MSMSMKMKTVSATVPADVKAEVAAVLAARGISMAAMVRELLACVAARDAETLAWLDEARR
jgi:DNA-damage-inducible protein J